VHRARCCEGCEETIYRVFVNARHAAELPIPDVLPDRPGRAKRALCRWGMPVSPGMSAGDACQPCQLRPALRQKFAIVRPKIRYRERYPLVESHNIAIVNDFRLNGPFTMANFWRKAPAGWHSTRACRCEVPRHPVFLAEVLRGFAQVRIRFPRKSPQMASPWRSTRAPSLACRPKAAALGFRRMWGRYIQEGPLAHRACRAWRMPQRLLRVFTRCGALSHEVGAHSVGKRRARSSAVQCLKRI